jgi:hypothetical protein
MSLPSSRVAERSLAAVLSVSPTKAMSYSTEGLGVPVCEEEP